MEKKDEEIEILEKDLELMKKYTEVLKDINRINEAIDDNKGE